MVAIMLMATIVSACSMGYGPERVASIDVVRDRWPSGDLAFTPDCDDFNRYYSEFYAGILKPLTAQFRSFGEFCGFDYSVVFATGESGYDGDIAEFARTLMDQLGGRQEDIGWFDGNEDVVVVGEIAFAFVVDGVAVFVVLFDEEGFDRGKARRIIRALKGRADDSNGWARATAFASVALVCVVSRRLLKGAGTRGPRFLLPAYSTGVVFGLIGVVVEVARAAG